MRTTAALAIAWAALLPGCGGEDVPELGNDAAEAAWACLADEGYDVTSRRGSEKDSDAPEVELTFRVGEGQVFVAYYASAAEAEEREPELQRNAERFAGSILRRGSIAIVTAGAAPAEDQAAISGCVF